MIQSRITSKAQTTVPRAIRQALGVGPGDRLVWESENGRATVKRLVLVDTREPFVNNFSTFTEWADDLDDEAFANL
jgi:antitoxin PrlF